MRRAFLQSLLASPLLLLPSRRSAVAAAPEPALAAVFEANRVNGTFVMLELATQRIAVHNRPRAVTRRIPASTFKIPNSLFALETGAVKDLAEVIPYGGKPLFVKAWERDMNLREAIKLSNVAIYQEVARRIGMPKMRELIARLGYGNGQLGEVVDRFWLDGPLQISALEQVQFLSRLIKSELPVSQRAMALTRELLLIEKTPEYALSAKTGWSVADKPHLGWWVGYVEKASGTYVFALNMDLHNPGDADMRQKLGRACLRELRILPS